jgi:TrmH family RNA methyltransferase
LIDQPPLITSSANPLVARIRKLATRKGRAQTAETFIEGIAVVRQAVASGVHIDTIVVAPDLLRSEDARRVIDTAAGRGAAVSHLGADLFKRISDRDNPAGLAAIVSPHMTELEDLAIDDGALVILLDNVGVPGNLGTVARTADAIGARGLVLAGNSTDPWDPAAIKASMGTLFELPVCTIDSALGAIRWARSKRLTTIATSARAARSIYDAQLRVPALVMFGSEQHGLDDTTLAGADEQVRIPIRGHASSLNLAVAAGITLFELTRRS